MVHNYMNMMQGVIKKEQANTNDYTFGLPVMLGGAGAKKIILPKKCSIKSKFPAVYSQPCNNCTTNAALAADDYYYHGPGKPWRPSTMFTYFNQRLLTCRENGDGDYSLIIEDAGSTVEMALKAIRKYGACSAMVWSDINPYDQKPSKAAYANGLKGHEVSKYYRLRSLKEVKQALAKGYPVVGAFAWLKFTYDENFIMDSNTREEFKHTYTGHAIVIVGYNDKEKLVEFRNSWGEDWGNKGYAYMTYKMFKDSVWWEDTYAVIK